MNAVMDFLSDSWWIVVIIAMPVTVFIYTFTKARNAKYDTDLWGPKAHLMHSHPDTQAEILARHPKLQQAIEDYEAGKPWDFPPVEAIEAYAPGTVLAMNESGEEEYPELAETEA